MSDASPSLLAVEEIIKHASIIGLNWAQKRRELAIDEKCAGQFASSADLELETQIRRELETCFPGHAVIGEEQGGSLGKKVTGWAIDPIDGTSNFILGLPLWGISVGHLQNGASTLGAIALPELGITISAEAGRGIRLNAAPFNPLTQKPRVKVISLGENDFEPGQETDLRAQQLREAQYAVVRYRCAVASLAFSSLGRLGGYVEHGCGLWDIAAAEIICREAGMSVDCGTICPGRYFIDARW